MNKCFCGICGECCNTEDFKLIEDESGAMLVEVINNDEDSKIQDLINNLGETNLIEIVSLNSLREETGLIKVAAKHKPNNPSMWTKCIAEAKKKFDVFPCVPVSNSCILTARGWKKYGDVSVGDKVISYNFDTKYLEWDTINKINFYASADTFRIFNDDKTFDFICTENHKWISEVGLISTKDIKENTNIIVSSSMSPTYRYPLSLNEFKDDQINIIDKVLAMSNEQRDGWFEVSTKSNSILDKDIAKAMDICEFLSSGTSLVSGIKVTQDKVADVWCPTTSNGTWIMNQDGLIAITGNSAYANGYASKLYKKKGGTWRTVKEKKNKRK